MAEGGEGDGSGRVLRPCTGRAKHNFDLNGGGNKCSSSLPGLVSLAASPRKVTRLEMWAEKRGRQAVHTEGLTAAPLSESKVTQSMARSQSGQELPSKSLALPPCLYPSVEQQFLRAGPHRRELLEAGPYVIKKYLSSSICDSACGGKD